MIKYLKVANLLSLLAFIGLLSNNSYSKARGIEPPEYLMTAMNITGILTIALFLTILTIIIISAIKDAKSHPHT